MPGYGSDAEFQSYLSDNGHTLPDGHIALAALRQRGSSYIDATYGPKLACSRPTGGIAQERAWPRTGHEIDGEEIDPDVIPDAWVRASYRAAWLEAETPGILSSSTAPGQRVARERVDVIEVAYHDDGAKEAGQGGIAFIDAEIDGLLTPYLCKPELGRTIWLRRG